VGVPADETKAFKMNNATATAARHQTALRRGGALAALTLLAGVTACATAPDSPDGYVTVADVIEGRATYEPSWVAKAKAKDQRGARPINSIIHIAPGLDQPEVWQAAGALGGVPILIKDNIDTRDMPTTAGSLALLANETRRDAPVVARLRSAGAVIMGKTNLSEWANLRGSNSVSGWSGVAGLTRNPHDLSRSTCGSSAGSAAAVAAGLAPAAIGTETDGSIVCPAAAVGIVGYKPTVGLVSRTHIIPISETQDTAGPMTLTVEDAAILLTVMAGSDPADRATVDADRLKVDYRAILSKDALSGQRIGVVRFLTGYSAELDSVFEQQLEVLRQAGAELVDITEGPDGQALSQAEMTVLLHELKAGLNDYLQSTDAARVSTRSLEDVIAFNARTPRETALFGQDYFEQSQATKGLSDPVYLQARSDALRLAGQEGIDRMLSQNNVVALVAPTTGAAWLVDPERGDDFEGSASQLAAVAGYPHLTLPMGQVRGLPVGISFFGAKWDDARILSLGYAYEQRSRAWRAPRYRDGGPVARGYEAALSPYARPTR